VNALATAKGGRAFARTRRAQARELLSASQVQWLGALLLCAQVPQLFFVPVWVAGFGIMLVVVRLGLLRRDRARPDGTPARIPSWTLALFAIATGAALKTSYGYLLGRDPCVAFLFVLVGIKYLETRTARDGSLLVCLASFLAVTPFFYSQSVLAAAMTLPALLALGATLQVLAQPSLRNLPLGRARGPVLQAGKLFAQGIPLAVLLFVLFPRLTGPLWGLPLDTAARTGLSQRMAPGIISELSMSDAVAFRVDFDGAVPPKRERYWRGPVLSTFDGREWTSGALHSEGKLARGGGRPVSYVVTLEPHDQRWLFALELPAQLPHFASDAAGEAPTQMGTLTLDKQLLASGPVHDALRYRVVSMVGGDYPADAATMAAESAENVALPRSRSRDNPRTRELAQTLRAQNPGDEAYVRAVIEWLRAQPFHYTLSPPLLPERAPVDAFLFDTQRGFCEHYASAFAVLLRAAGVPARVVTGYQGGDMNPNGDYLIVRQSDAHAWTEALIGGRWKRFDPTGVVAPSRIDLGLGGALPSGERVPLLARLDSGWIGEIELAWDAFNHDWRRHVVGFNYERQRALFRELRIDLFSGWEIVLMVAAAAALWGTLLLAWLAYRKRRQDRERWLWDAMCERLAHAGLRREIHEGPLAYVARAAARWPDYAVAFEIIGAAYAGLRYGAMPERRRPAALARLARAIDVLPPPAALRATPPPTRI
jgi:transglutaminase-like putative cysteine protease